MENNENNVVSQQKDVPDNVDYIEAIKEIKSNTVDKEAYLKLKEENKKLINSLVQGETLENAAKPEVIDVKELRKNLFNKDQSNLSYIQNAIKLRESLIEEGERDPFLPYGRNIIPTEEDIKASERVASVLNECVNYADGNSDIFTSELQRRMVDTAPIRRKK